MAAHKGRAEEVESAVMSRELKAAESTRHQHKVQAHVDSLTMQTELFSAECQLSDAEALTQATRVEAREAAREADVRQAAVAAELPLAESSSLPQAARPNIQECFARLSVAIEEVQPHLQEQAYRELYETAMACFRAASG